MIPELQTAIVSRVLTGTNDFKTAISSKFYFAIAPSGTSGKYAVLSDVSNPNFLDTGSIHEECYFQIAIYETSTNDISSAAGVYDAATKLKALFDEQTSSITVAGYHLISLRRMNTIGARRTELNNGYTIILNYYALLERGR